MEDTGAAAVEDVDVVVVGVLVVGIIGPLVQVVGLVELAVPRDMVVVDPLMEAMVVVVVGMVEVEVIHLVAEVSKGGGNCANTSMQPIALTGYKKNKTSKKSILLPFSARLSLSHPFPSPLQS